MHVDFANCNQHMSSVINYLEERQTKIVFIAQLVCHRKNITTCSIITINNDNMNMSVLLILVNIL